jgi:hypothetical protein
MPCCQRGDLNALDREERIRDHEDRADFLAGEIVKGSVDFELRAGLLHKELHPK